MSMEITSSTTVGEVVAADYRNASVFEQYGIDFCCGGNISLEQVCKDKGVKLADLLTELGKVQSEPVDRSQNYLAWSLSFLADYIVNTHHSYLYETDDQLVAYTKKIATVHGEHHPELLEIARIFEKIATDMAGHLKEEEEQLFPAIKRAEGMKNNGNEPAATDRELIASSLAKLHREHDEIGDAIHEIRRLAADYKLPADACNTFTLTYRKLAEYEDDLHKHVHLENNILFPKAAKL